MDPNTALAEIPVLIAKTYTDEGATLDDGCRLYDLVEALDGWLTQGGFLPDAWQRAASTTDADPRR